MNHPFNPNADLSKTEYVVEFYADEHRTLCQSIMYRIDYEWERQDAQARVNPNLDLKRRDYCDKEHKIIFSEVWR